MMRTLQVVAISGLMLLLCRAVFAIDDDEGSEEVTVETVSDVVEDIPYSSPIPSGNYYMAEHFDDPAAFKKKWILSEAKKEGIDDDIAKYDGVWEVEPPQRDGLKGDQGLVLKSKAKHAAISARLTKPFFFVDKPLVVQYEVLLQEGQECGGSYIKLLSADKSGSDLRTFHDKTPYTIMFGPDKCGNDHKLHFIFRHKNPKNGTLSEKHCKKPKDRLEDPFKDKQPHLYTLIMRPDNTFQISLDHKIIKEGNLLEDFEPEVNPPSEIDDPNDRKPSDWDETEKIPDPDARKPDDWDEDAPAQIPDPTATKPDGWLDNEQDMIPDPNAEKPADWDNEMDGEWEAPLIPNPVCEKSPGCGKWTPPLINNPEYKGKWRAPLVANPNYKGRWKPRRISNPDFFEDHHPFRMTPINAVGIELWSMSNMILFDNILITDDPAVAAQYAADSFDLKRKKLDKSAESLVSRVINYSNENPWLYAVYIVAVGLPVVLILVFCCGSSSESEEQKRAAQAKKTDEDQPDDQLDEDAEADEQDEVNGDEAEDSEAGATESTATTASTATTTRSSKASKSQLDLQEDKAEVKGEGDGDVPRSPKKRRARKD